MRKVIIALALTVVSVNAASISIPEIIKSYTNERSKVLKLKEAIKETTKQTSAVIEHQKTTLKNQQKKTLASKNLSSALSLLVKQTSNMADAQAHRASALDIQNKQVIQRLMSESSRISKEEIKEYFQERGKIKN